MCISIAGAFQDLYKDTGCAQRLARHPYFENSVLCVIFLNAIWMSVDIDNNPAAVLVDAPTIFVVMENFFCLFFTSELLIRFFAFATKRVRQVELGRKGVRSEAALKILT